MKLTSPKSTSIPSLPPSFLTLDFLILHNNIVIDDKILKKNHSSTFLEREKSSPCDDNRISTTDNGGKHDSYSVSRSLSLKNKLVHMCDKYVTAADTDPSSSLSSSSKSSKRKLNKTTGSNAKVIIKAFVRTSIEDPASRTQRSRVVNKSRVPQHISRPPVAHLSRNNDNVSPTACVEVFLRMRPPHTNTKKNRKSILTLF